MESFFIGVEAKPSESFGPTFLSTSSAMWPPTPSTKSFTKTGAGLKPPIAQSGYQPIETITLGDVERFKVYRADISWNAKHFDLERLLPHRALPLGL
jgi:hypothetical protein